MKKTEIKILSNAKLSFYAHTHKHTHYESSIHTLVLVFSFLWNEKNQNWILWWLGVVSNRIPFTYIDFTTKDALL